MRCPGKTASFPADSILLEGALLGILNELLPPFRAVLQLPWSQITVVPAYVRKDKWTKPPRWIKSTRHPQTFINCSSQQFHLCTAPQLITRTIRSVTHLSLLQYTHTRIHMHMRPSSCVIRMILICILIKPSVMVTHGPYWGDV